MNLDQFTANEGSAKEQKQEGQRVCREKKCQESLSKSYVLKS